MEYLTLISKILAITITGILLYRLYYHLISKFRERGLLDEQVFFICREAGKWLLVIFALLLVFQQFGIEASRILTALSAVFVLVAVGFVAVWSVLSNILCAVLLLTFPPFRFGDEIELKEADKESGVRGKVIGLSLFFTTLENKLDGESGKQVIKIPNTMFFQRIITCHEGTNTQKLKLKTVPRDENQVTPGPDASR